VHEAFSGLWRTSSCQRGVAQAVTGSSDRGRSWLLARGSWTGLGQRFAGAGQRGQARLPLQLATPEKLLSIHWSNFVKNTYWYKGESNEIDSPQKIPLLILICHLDNLTLSLYFSLKFSQRTC
jgi:hypothetical protein